MNARRLLQKLRALLDADERLGRLEASAQAAADRSAANEAALAASRTELREHRGREGEARGAATTALRSEIAGIASGLEALEDCVSSVETAARARQGLLDERLAALEAAVRAAAARAAELETRITSGLEALSRQVSATRADLRIAEVTIEDARHVVSHQAEQLDLLKSSLEVDPLLIGEFQQWKARHPLSDRPLVSVCIATYNRSRLLRERCLPSVLSQTYPHLEVVVVGDGCTDDTAEQVATVADPRVRFLNLARRGQYPDDPLRRWMVAGTRAVNKALARARGELVTHLDDDDEYLPDRLEKLVSFVRDNDCDLVWHPFWYEDPDGRWQVKDAPEFAFSHVTTSSVLYRSWFKKIRWDAEAHRLMEPGDWNRFRRIRYVGALCRRFPEALLRHYREQRPRAGRDGAPRG